jgi:YwiC-like protein
MFPKEHGAYGQLLFPLITALAIGRPTVSAFSIAAVAVLIFLAHEPLLTLLGQRGSRAARERRGQALRWFVASTAAAIAAGLVAIVTIDPAIRVTLAIPAALAAIVVMLIVARREHTMAGEIASAIALSSLAVPVSLASGATPVRARTCAIVFAVAFVAATVCVRAVIANTRRPPALDARGGGVLMAILGIAALVSLASQAVVSSIAPWAAAPLAVGGGVLAIVPPSARQLRIVGWTLVATTAVTSLVLVVGLR